MLIINTVLSNGVELMTYDPLRSHTELHGLRRYPESEIGVFKRSQISYIILHYPKTQEGRVSVLGGLLGRVAEQEDSRGTCELTG